MRVLITACLLVALSPFAGASDCGGMLSEASVRLNEIVKELHRLGLKRLIEPFDHGLVRVEWRRARKASPPSQVGWRNTWLIGKRVLTVRQLKWQNEAERQRAIWDVAAALFRLELADSLWSLRAMIPTGPGALNTYNLPQAWAEDRLEALNAYEGELYRLLERLPAVSAAEVLPVKDPGRHWLLTMALLRDVGARVFPNQSDRGGDYTLANERRYGLAAVVNYYVDWVKRLAAVAGVAGGVYWAAPAVLDWPGHVHTQAIMHRQQSELTPMQRKTELEQALREERAKVIVPNADKIQDLQRQYNELRATNPEIFPNETGKISPRAD